MITACLFLLLLLPAAGDSISRYEATFELAPDSDHELRDVAVTLAITYNVGAEPRSSGFKYVGALPVREISVTDEDGRPFEFEFEEGENQVIRWWFPPVSRSEQVVIIRFVVVEAVKGSLEENRLRMNWVNEWNLPVHNVTYRFFPPGNLAFDEFEMKPGVFKETVRQGRPAVESHLQRLVYQPFAIRFSPGLVEEKFYWEGFAVLLGIFAVIPGFLLLLKWLSRYCDVGLPFSGAGCGGCSGCGGCGGCGGCSG